MSVEGMWRHARERPDAPALLLGDDVRSRGELAARARQLAGALRERGVDGARPVAVMLPNGFELFEVGVAAAALGARFLPVNWHLKGDEVAHILGDSGAAVLVAHESLREHADAAVGAARRVAVLLVGGGDGRGAEAIPRARSYEAALAGAEPVREERWPAPGYMFYTSGTTGRPKGVVHGDLTADRLELMNRGLVDLWGISAGDVYLLSGPGYHAGPGGWAFAHLYAGGSVAILPRWDARGWLAAVERHRVTTTFVAPAHLIRILEVPEEERGRADLSSLRLVIHAGAPCPVPVKWQAMEALPSAGLWELYGMSEGGATRVSPDEWRERPGTVGRPWPGVEVRILDDDGNEQPAGEPGIVHVSPMGGRFEYHDDSDKTERAWRGGLYTVGDVGYLDDEGYLFLTDRATDVVIRGGVNISPAEIESVLHEHPDVVDCAVFGVPDERDGEHLAAVVEARRFLTPEEVREHVRARLADFKCPELVDLVGELPRDPNGKVLKRRLAERHGSREAPDHPPS